MAAVLQRYDRSRLGRATPTPVGGVRVPAFVSRTGVQSYRMPDGSVRREYRSPEEVFHPDSLASFRGASVTVGHPARVTPKTFKALSVGFILDAPTQAKEADGQSYAAVHLDVNDADAVSAVADGKLCENSLGYTCDWDPTPGTDPVTGEKFDGYQRNIRINHSALLEQGQARAGRLARVVTDQSDEAAEMRLDADGNQVAAPAAESKRQMKILIGGKELEGTELQAAVCLLEQANKTASDRADAAEGKAAAEKARADKAEKDRTDAVAAASPEAIAKLVADESEFRALVAPVLGDKFDFAGKSRKDVKIAAVEKLDGLKIDSEKSDAFVDGCFESAMSHVKKAEKKDAGASGSEDYSKRDTSKLTKADAELADMSEAEWAARIDQMVADKSKKGT